MSTVAGCVFCTPDLMVGRETVLHQPTVYSLPPLNPVTPGHLLFISEEHVTDAAVASNLTADVMRAAARHARLQAEPFNLITSAGAAATQSVWHLHVHYVPRREGDGLHLPWTGQTT